MFDRYTEQSRRALFFARYEATQEPAARIAPHHLLLGLLRESDVVRNTLSQAGLDVGDVRDRFLRAGASPDGGASIGVEIPFTERTKTILARAAIEANESGSRDITPAHLLLAILHDKDSDAARLLLTRGVRAEAVRQPLAVPQAAQLAEIPASVSLRVSIGSRRAPSVTKGPRHWFLEGFTFVGALSEIAGIPETRIALPEDLTRQRPVDLYLLLPNGPVIGGIDAAMRSAFEEHFNVSLGIHTQGQTTLVVTPK
jgi:hypothetical protein